MEVEDRWRNDDASASSRGLGTKSWIICGVLFLVFIVVGAMFGQAHPIANVIGMSLASATVLVFLIRWWQLGEGEPGD